MLKAFKFRIYPTEDQKAELAKQFGHARFVHNAALELRKAMYFDHGVSFNYYDCADVLTQVKRERPELAFLKEANAQILQQSLKDLDNAYSRYSEAQSKATKRRDGVGLSQL